MKNRFLSSVFSWLSRTLGTNYFIVQLRQDGKEKIGFGTWVHTEDGWVVQVDLP